MRLIGGDGGPVVPVMAFLGELQASGRSAATQRSRAHAPHEGALIDRAISPSSTQDRASIRPGVVQSAFSGSPGTDVDLILR